MFNYIIRKYNMNVTSMIRNGTVAVITMKRELKKRMMRLLRKLSANWRNIMK